ncbi:MAG: MmoB/DmpM family protein [Proteobacteria bacterium]|nr:MmoB/DmpM family protein [Pseudomonadota bacterium]
MNAVVAEDKIRDLNLANDSVCIVLMKSPETDATLDYLAADHPHVKCEDLGPYWLVSSEGEIVIDIARVGEELGEKLSLGSWLVIMSSFVGRVVTDPMTFRVTSHMTDLESPA